MADIAVADPPPSSTVNDFNSLQVPPLDPHFLNQDLLFTNDGALNCNSVDQNDDIILGDLDFDLDFSFDDLLPDSLEQPLLEPNCFVLPGSDPNLTQFVPDRNLKDVTRALKTTSPEFLHVSGGHFCADGVISNSSSLQAPEVCELSGDEDSDGQCSERNQLSAERGQDVSGYLNFPSPESNGSKGSNDSRVLNCLSPESQGSGNCGSDVSEDSNKSVSSSPNFGNTSARNAHKVKLEELNNSSNNQVLLKRKKESEDSHISDSRTNKFRKSNNNIIENTDSKNNNVVLSEEEEKKRARLMRNRESAQLSRQRKKHYVEELEDKVKNMGSTIQELNSQIAYISHENARLRQQLGGGMVLPAPMGVPPPPAGVYPQMMYPWMPCGVPPYLVKPQGSHVPLVPIPRLKPQQPVPAPKTSKKAESKKSEKSEGKTKKVASVSFLGLMFFVLLFGGFVPMVNVRYGGMRETFRGGSGYAESQFYEKHHGKVLAVDGNISGNNYGDRHSNGRDLIKNNHPGRGHGGNIEHENDNFVHVGNGSSPLAASLYVPRNDKLVKIDGNLIIHSFLASERAMASRDDAAKKAGVETQLAVHGDLGPVFPISGGRPPHPHRNPTERQRALGSSVKETLKSSAVDGRLQEWFREGLEGPMLSSGMCTEVFQFDVSSAIVPATTHTRNVSMEQGQNSTHLNKGKNRRILRGRHVTLSGSPHNISDGHPGSDSQEKSFKKNDSLTSSMVVSVLVDPREAGDVDGSGVMGPKSLSRIFVVVLIDSVKYVTYSCMLPIKGAVPHLVTT